MVGAGAMKMKKARHAIFFVILLCTFTVENSEGKRRLSQNIFRTESRKSTSPKMSVKMAEEAWIHSRKEMAVKRDAIKDFDPYMPQAINDVMSALLEKPRIEKAIENLPPQVRQMFFECLRKKGVIFHAFDLEVNSKHCLLKCIQIIFKLPNVPRRYLVSISNQHITSGPFSAQAFEKAPERISAVTPLTKPFTYSSSLSVHKRDANEVQYSAEQKQDAMKETVFVVIVTAAATFAAVSLFFFCCLNGSGENKEEKPLLHLSDYLNLTPYSSETSFSIQSSSNGECSSSSSNMPSFAVRSSTKQYDEGALLAKVSLKETEGAPIPPLKPPPGNSTLSESPPLSAPPHPPPLPRQPAPSAPPAPAARAPPPHAGPNPPPLPPSKGARPPPPLPPKAKPLQSVDESGKSETPKAKLKPFFWDKVTANTDHTMVWHEIKTGSFQFNEKEMESLFGYNVVTNKKNSDQKGESTSESSSRYIQIIDSRKAQNLSILLRALNVTSEEVVDALQEGSELSPELLQTLEKMQPTTDEELKLRLFTGDVSQLGPAERFLKSLVEIPFSFQRIESLMFVSTLHDEVNGIKESFATLEVACTKLKSSRLFHKILEAVLKTGNRMNLGTYRGGAQAFKLDTLLKLSDVKGTDGKTTLLHFVVQEIVRSEGMKAVRLQSKKTLSNHIAEGSVQYKNQDREEDYHTLGLEVVSGVSTELEDVKRAAIIDADALTSAIAKFNHLLKKNKEFLNTELKSSAEGSGFFKSLSGFVDHAETTIKGLSEEEKRIMDLVRDTADYFHGKPGKNEGLRLFTIVGDFLIMIDKICKDVRDKRPKLVRIPKPETASTSASTEKQEPSAKTRKAWLAMRERLFPAISRSRRESTSYNSSSCSEDENSS